MRPIQKCFFSIIGVVIILILVPIMVLADVPQLINFQGKLIEDDVAVTGSRTMTFSLWDSDTGGSPTSGIWSETQLSVEIIDGNYNVQLGSASSLPLDLYTYDQLYLQIDIIHPTEGSQRLSPLLELVSTVFALKASDADMLNGNTADTFAQNVHNHSGSDINAGVVADAHIADTIARDSEINWLNLDDVPGDFADGVDNTGITNEIDPTVDDSIKDGISWSEVSNRPAGLDDGDQLGITVETDPTVAAEVKDGVSWTELSDIPAGFADDVDNTRVGTNSINYVPKWNGVALVSGEIFDNGNIGIGMTNPAHKLDVEGTINGSTTIPDDPDEVGVRGKHAQTGNHGEIGHLDYAVAGFNANGNHGVLGQNDSGIWGHHQSSGNHGAIANAYAGAFGAYKGGATDVKTAGGLGTAGEGAYGVHNASGNFGVLGNSKAAVYGEADAINNYLAGQFAGNVEIYGNLSAHSKSFKIDHPLDPDKKYLYHATVESSERVNMYNGNATMDENGEAEVDLPEWFQALNKDYRYQLTCIGGFSPVYIAEEIYNNRFKIAGGKPGMRVSWQVIGIRQDAYAVANPLVVEELKN